MTVAAQARLKRWWLSAGGVDASDSVACASTATTASAAAAAATPCMTAVGATPVGVSPAAVPTLPHQQPQQQALGTADAMAPADAAAGGAPCAAPRLTATPSATLVASVEQPAGSAHKRRRSDGGATQTTHLPPPAKRVPTAADCGAAVPKPAISPGARPTPRPAAGARPVSAPQQRAGAPREPPPAAAGLACTAGSGPPGSGPLVRGVPGMCSAGAIPPTPANAHGAAAWVQVMRAQSGAMMQAGAHAQLQQQQVRLLQLAP